MTSVRNGDLWTCAWDEQRFVLVIDANRGEVLYVFDDGSMFVVMQRNTWSILSDPWYRERYYQLVHRPGVIGQ